MALSTGPRVFRSVLRMLVTSLITSRPLPPSLRRSPPVASLTLLLREVAESSAPLRARLGSAAEAGVGIGQQQSSDPHRFGTVEVDVGEAVAVRPELHADIHGAAIEILCRRLRRDDA